MTATPRNPRKPNPATPIGARLIELDRSYQWLGRQIGFEGESVRRWAEGVRHPNKETKRAISATLERNESELFPGHDGGEPTTDLPSAA